MLMAKRLLVWHQAKEAVKQAERVREEYANRLAQHDQLIQQLTEKLAAVPAPQTPDEEIAKLLLEQELWMANNERDRYAASHQKEALRAEQTIQQKSFEIVQWEQELDGEALAQYYRIAENKANPLAEVRNNSCTVCFMPLSLSKMSEWRRGKGLVYCDECGRILV
ncbi:C4-type zinc ribbon domain-containing protein [Brevibacillus fulvus]|uniref:Nucleic acid-binding Zn-ribbon protein n=1 Tax=Brevibacillus fulvus TaxID=1125967 RepID=A0A938XTJ9_9BACL|nr:C4-type zinc ribbon domain-containing protein [Brevibacillus fulvus]MBM7589837.1 putative nucleic acid-binding Zn-ribbon protein [Brevibacillus fulvus]